MRANFIRARLHPSLEIESDHYQRAPGFVVLSWHLITVSTPYDRRGQLGCPAHRGADSVIFLLCVASSNLGTPAT